MPLRVVKRRGTRLLHIAGTVRGESVRETTGTSDPVQAELYRAMREAKLYETAIVGGRPDVSFQRAALSYIEAEPRSAKTLWYIAKLTDHFTTTPIAQAIEQTAADAAIATIVGVDAAPATKNRAVVTPLRAIGRHAAARKWCDVPQIKAAKVARSRTVAPQPRQALAIIDAAAPHLRALLLFLAGCGARVNEALTLDWPNVDLAAAEAIFRDTKTGEERVASLPQAVVVALANLPGPRVGRVFRRDDGEPYAQGKPHQSGGQIETGFVAACRRAGFAEQATNDDGTSKTTPYKLTLLSGEVVKRQRPVWRARFTPHTFRHAWASWFYALTKDLMLLKDEGGWQTTKMVERYTHLLPSDKIQDITLVWGDSHPRIGLLPGRAGQTTATVGDDGRLKA